MKLARNNPCICGSGKKIKKCHDQYVGLEQTVAMMTHNILLDIESQPGYVPPMSDEERRMWRQSGCPFGMCSHETDGGSCAASNCGV